MNGVPRCLNPVLVFSGASKTAFRAVKTEQAMSGKSLDVTTLRNALKGLDTDLLTAGVSTAPGSQIFRTKLIQSFLYKFVLTCQGNALAPELESAIAPSSRPVSKATEVRRKARGLLLVALQITDRLYGRHSTGLQL